MSSSLDLLLGLYGITPASGSTTQLWWDLAWPAVMVPLVAVGALVAALLPWLALKGAAGWQRGAVVALRAAAAGLLGLMLLQPHVVLLSPVEGRQRLAVVVDRSQSMSVATASGQPSRWSQALAALSPEGTLSELGEHYQVDIFALSDRLEPVGDLAALSGLTPDGESTDVGAALQQLTREGKDLGLGGVLLLSDGIDRGPLRRTWAGLATDPAAGAQALRDGLRPLDLPIHTVTVGDERTFVDVAIDDLAYNEFAFLRQPAQIDVKVRARGVGGRTTSMKLSQGKQVLAVENFTLPGDGEVATVSFQLTPDRVGKFTYTLATPVLPEEVVPGNNTRSFTLKVVRDRIRVLQIVGAPSWDEKFMRRLLKADPNVDLVSFFILRTRMDRHHFPERDYSLIEFPYLDLFDKDLSTFDVVIFQNFNYAPYFESESYRLLGNLARFVRDGGGVAVIGGELAFAGGDYGGTPLEEVLPVRSDLAPSVLETPFQFRLTADGARHPVSHLHFDPAENRRTWEKLPRMDGFNPVSLQPGAVVLGEVEGRGMPALAVRQVEKGRTLALMTDTSWYWSFKASGAGLSNNAYLRFWKNALRWLVGDPDEGQVQVDTEKENYRLGQKVVLSVRVVGVDYAPLAGAKVDVKVTPEAGGAPTAWSGVTSPAGDWSQPIEPGGVGPFRVEVQVTQEDGREVGKAQTVFTVNEEGPEMKELGGDGAFLKALSEATGGRSLPLDERLTGELAVRPLAESASTSRTLLPLWNRPLNFAALLALLCGEWLLRRRWGLK